MPGPYGLLRSRRSHGAHGRPQGRDSGQLVATRRIRAGAAHGDRRAGERAGHGRLDRGEVGRHEALARLDQVRASARWANEYGGLALDPSAGPLHLIAARHPLLAMGERRGEVVPLDLPLTDGGRLLLVSGPNMGVLIITHHERLLEFNVPQFTHVMLGGRIVETGDAALAHELHANGCATVRARHPEEDAENAKVEAAAAV